MVDSEDYEQKYLQQIGLQVQNNATYQEEKYPQEIELQTKTITNEMHQNNSYDDIHMEHNTFNAIEYKLDKINNQIIVNKLENEDAMYIVNSQDKCCLYYKYRSEYLMNHRRERYNIVLIPLYILFVVFTTFTILAVYDRFNTDIAYINTIVNYQFQSTFSEMDFQELKQCNIEFESVYGWFDARSLRIDENNNNNIKWFDYSLHKNHIYTSNISTNIKLGIFNHNHSNFYIYGSKFDSIHMPFALNINKYNYTIIALARYNGNDHGSIFSSSNNELIFGFKNDSSDIIYHQQSENTTSNTSASSQKWTINVDTPYIFRSNHTHASNYVNKSSGEWGINMMNSSDWAIGEILLFNQLLSVTEIECIENMLLKKYYLRENNTINNSSKNISYPTIYECDRWSSNYYDQIVGWYDVNTGFDNNVLFDLSTNKNDILLENIKIGIEPRSKFKYLYGSTNDVLHIPIIMNNKYAIYYVARYNGNNQGFISVISDHSIGFWCGFKTGNGVLCHWNEQKLLEINSDIYSNEWVLTSFLSTDSNIHLCTQNCRTYFDVDLESYDYTLNLTINGRYNSEWALTEIIIVDLNSKWAFSAYRDTMCIEKYLSHKYGINSYEYNTGDIILFQVSNWPAIVCIFISVFGIFIWKVGFCAKGSAELCAQFFQCCCYTCHCCADSVDCCCGTFRGLCARHICGCQISIFPISNLLSTMSLIVSFINRFNRSRNELMPHLFLNGLCIALSAILQCIFIFQYIIGNTVNSEMLNNFYPLYYLIQIKIFIFLWCIGIIEGIRNY
eukprot:498335_1